MSNYVLYYCFSYLHAIRCAKSAILITYSSFACKKYDKQWQLHFATKTATRNQSLCAPLCCKYSQEGSGMYFCPVYVSEILLQYFSLMGTWLLVRCNSHQGAMININTTRFFLIILSICALALRQGMNLLWNCGDLLGGPLSGGR